MSDEAGGDDKVVAVLGKDPRWAHIQDVDDIPEYTRKEITHFFEHYKDLEPASGSRSTSGPVPPRPSVSSPRRSSASRSTRARPRRRARASRPSTL